MCDLSKSVVKVTGNTSKKRIKKEHWKRSMESCKRYAPTGMPSLPICHHQMKMYKCETLNTVDLLDIHKFFYLKNEKIYQDNYIIKHCRINGCRRQRSNRSLTVKYSLPRKTTMELVPVCKKTFTQVLGVKKDRVSNVLKRSFDNYGEIAKENRGGDRRSKIFCKKGDFPFTAQIVAEHQLVKINDEYDSKSTNLKMQLIPDAVHEASMSDKQIIAMESSTIDQDTIDISTADSLKATPNHCIDASAEDVMVVIPDPYSSKEIKDEVCILSELKELLSDISHCRKNENSSTNGQKANQNNIQDNDIDNVNDSQIANEKPDIDVTTDKLTANPLNNSKQLNGIVNVNRNCDSVEDVNVPDTAIDTKKTDDSNGIIKTIKVEVAEEVEDKIMDECISSKTTVQPEVVKTVKVEVAEEVEDKDINEGISNKTTVQPEVVKTIKVEVAEEVKDKDINEGISNKITVQPEVVKTIKVEVAEEVKDKDINKGISSKTTVQPEVVKTECPNVDNVSNILGVEDMKIENDTCPIDISDTTDVIKNTEQVASDSPSDKSSDINDLKEKVIPDVLSTLPSDIVKSDVIDVKEDFENYLKAISGEDRKSNIEVPNAMDQTNDNSKPASDETKVVNDAEISPNKDDANKKSDTPISAAVSTPAIIDTLNLDSDDEMDGKKVETKCAVPANNLSPKECISVDLDDDDDDIMLVDDDQDSKKTTTNISKDSLDNAKGEAVTPLSKDLPNPSTHVIPNKSKEDGQTSKDVTVDGNDDDIVVVNDDKAVPDNLKSETIDTSKPKSLQPQADNSQNKTSADDKSTAMDTDKEIIGAVDEKKIEKDSADPSIPLEFKLSFKSNIEQLSRNDLEEFCLVKMVEGIVARSNLSDVRLKLKMLQKNIEEWRKKVNDLTKQNKDLDTVVRAVSDVQKKTNEEHPVPIKITRSVGLQVGFTCHPTLSKPPETKPPPVIITPVPKKPKQPRATPAKQNQQTPQSSPANRTLTNQGNQKKTTPIPVPRIVAANKSPAKSNDKNSSPATPSPVTPSPTNTSTLKNALQNTDNRKQTAEKRSAAFQSIDLTDDEPPAKQPDMRTLQAKLNALPAIVKPQIRPNIVTKMMQPVNRIGFIGNIPANRPLFFPINTPQQNNVNNNTLITPRKIVPNINRHTLVRLPSVNNNQIRMGHSIPIHPQVSSSMRHPAPLPQAPTPKQMSHPSWKWIPPRPNLKITKAENGIVISWEMEGFLDTRHEEVASYQIYAYQETNAPPNTDLWKKIGDVKSLPLPMACTLTKFMAGFKYYFAVRAVDIRTRVGPFSAPGQILLLNEK